jgi:hypothetical protein
MEAGASVVNSPCTVFPEVEWSFIINGAMVVVLGNKVRHNMFLVGLLQYKKNKYNFLVSVLKIHGVWFFNYDTWKMKHM